MKKILGVCLTALILAIPINTGMATPKLPLSTVIKPVAKVMEKVSTPRDIVSLETGRHKFLYWPTGRPVPVPRRFDPPAQKWLAGHRGIDLRVTPGETVYAATDATVLYAGPLAGRPVISLEDSSGRRYTYEPVEPSIAVGDEVLRGAPIGIALGGHYPGDNRLHFGVKDGPDGYVDPLKLLGGRIRLWPLH